MSPVIKRILERVAISPSYTIEITPFEAYCLSLSEEAKNYFDANQRLEEISEGYIGTMYGKTIFVNWSHTTRIIHIKEASNDDN